VLAAVDEGIRTIVVTDAMGSSQPNSGQVRTAGVAQAAAAAAT